MSRPPIPDTPARDVATGAAPGSLDRTVFVDAGAGTGKTTALVDRIVRLVRDGVPVTGIAAITFTEAAAAELRHRVREAVEDAAVASPDDGHLAGALAAMDDATFTTLHAFAQSILLDHPVAAGLPPEVELMDELETRAAFDRAFDRWLADLLERDAAAELLARGADLGFTANTLWTMVDALHQDHDRLPDALRCDPDVLPDPPEVDLDTLLGDMDELIARARDIGGTDKLVQHIVGPVAEARAELGRARMRGLRGSPLLMEAERLLSAASKPGNVGAKAAWGDGGAKVVRDRLRSWADEVELLRLEQASALLEAWLPFACEFLDGWAAERRRTGRLTFQDLLVLARDVLLDADVRRQVHARYSHLLVDEFQDTDPLQIEIAALLAAEDPDVVSSDWQQTPVAPGRLFLVGDPKQSIYRFRRADIQVYERAKEQLVGTAEQLSHNFRCAAGIVDFVNAAFSELIQARPGAQPPYQPLTAHRDGVDGPVVHVFGGRGEGTAQEVRLREAEDTRRAIASIVGRLRVQDRDGTERPAAHRDIAVLVRRHATARMLERVLDEAGVPYRLESRSLIHATQEVVDLLAILSAVEDPADEVAVVAALRHPAFGCSDRDLTAWVAAGNGWDHTRMGERLDDADGPVAEGLRRLRALHDARWGLTVGAVVERVIDDLRLMELACTSPRPRDRWRRIRFVADQAHAFHAAGGHLRGFVRYLQEQAAQEVRADEHVVEETDDDAVRITTVHGAKGLEYPVVIALGLDMPTDRPPFDPRVIFSEGELELNLSKVHRTLGYDLVSGAERQMHREEERRLLYVATTRARDHLVLSLHHPAAGSNDRHATDLLAIDGLADLWATLDLDAGAVRATGDQLSLGGLDTPPDDRTAELEAFTRHRAEALAAIGSPRTIAATGIAQRLAAVDDLEDEDGTDAAEVDDTEPWRKGRAGTNVGRAVHAVLQSVDLSSERGLDDLARAQAAAEGLPARDADRIRDMARRAVRSDAVVEAITTGRYWRELPVAASLGDLTVEGFIDLLYEDAEGRLVVVDYKTDSVRGRTPAETVERYRHQAATYALVLEETLGRTVARCTFVLTQASEAERQVVIEGEALATAVAEVRDAIGAG